MSKSSFALLTTGALTGQRYATSDDTLTAFNIPAGTFAVDGFYDAALYRYDLTLSAIVLRDPTPVVAQLFNLSVVLTNVPLGAAIVIGGDTSLTTTNTNPAGIVTLNFAATGNYTLSVGCFPSQDFALSFKLPPTASTQTGALGLTGNAPVLFPQRITVPSGALVGVGTGPASPSSSVVPKVAALALTGAAPTIQTNVPGTVDMLLTGQTASVVVAVQNRTITPLTAALRMQLGFEFPMTGVLSLTGAAPTLTMTGSVGNITPATGALAVMGLDNALLNSKAVTGAAALSIAAAAPAVVSAIVPKTATLTFTVNPAPVPDTGTLTLTGN